MSRTRSPRRRTPQSCPPPWLWLSAGLLLGVCISVLASLYGLLPAPPGPAVTQTVPPPPAPARKTEPSPAPPPAVLDTPKKPKETKAPEFTFYDELENPSPGNPVQLRPEDFPVAGENPAGGSVNSVLPASLPEDMESGEYLVQVGAFRDQAAAQHLRNYLTDLGFSAAIQAATVNGVTWFRTQVGPFATEFQARQAQVRLMEHNFKDALLMRF